MLEILYNFRAMTVIIVGFLSCGRLARHILAIKQGLRLLAIV